MDVTCSRPSYGGCHVLGKPVRLRNHPKHLITSMCSSLVCLKVSLDELDSSLLALKRWKDVLEDRNESGKVSGRFC